MKTHKKLISFFSYIFGAIALIAVIFDNKKDKLYSFFIWQAFLLNLSLGIISAIVYGFYLPKHILSLDIALRTSFSLKVFLIPFTIIIILFFILGIMSYKEIKFNIPLVGFLARKITKK